MFFIFILFWYIFSYYTIVASAYFDTSDHHHYHPQKQQQQQGLEMRRCISGPLVCFLFSFSLIHFFSFYYSFNLPWCIWLQLPPPSKTTGLKTQCVSSARYDFFFFCYFTMLMSFKSSPLLRMETTGVVGGGVKSSRCVTIRLELVP